MTAPACERHPWGEASGLVCVRTDAHERGHVFASSAGPDLDDEAHHAREDDQ